MSPKNSNFERPSPVLLSSSCDVLSSNSAVPDMGLLSYPFRRAVVIEEIRFVLRIASSSTFNLGSVVSARLVLGQNYLMRDPVPVWLLGTLADFNLEEANDAYLATRVSVSQYRWRLPQPLYIEAGQFLHPVFSRGADGFGSINAQVSFVGRTVPPNQPRPKVLAVPYAASFVTTAGNTYDQSNEKHLFNPFNKTLNVQRLTGRVAVTATTKLKTSSSLTPATAGSAVTILMNDSWGGKIVNNNTGPSDVFDAPHAAWTVDAEMPPKGVYEARVWNISTNDQVHIGMIGYREEAL